MAGRGPRPKDPQRRARTNSDPVPLRVIKAEPVEQPPLPTFYVEKNGELTEYRWPAVTLEWWSLWGGSPLTESFGATDWDFMMDTALIHAEFWSGKLSYAAELRLRVAKVGATPEDRARLRITYAAADEADEKRVAPRSARQTYNGLKLAD